MPNRFLLIVMSSALFIPIYINIGGAPIYIVQSVVIVLVAFAIVVKNEITKPEHQTTFNVLIGLYLIWVLISFFANSALDLIAGNFSFLSNRLASLIYFALTITPYLISSVLIKKETHALLFIKYANFSFFMLIMFYLKNYILLDDLYLARELIGQRVPLIIVFLAWALSAIFLVDKSDGNIVKIVTFFSSSVLVALSLTRAAYIQWIFSLLIYLFIFKKDIVKINFFLALMVILIMPSIWMAYSIDFYELISERFNMLLNPVKLASGEESANIRILIWKSIINELSSDPFHLLFGYGQLGSSYMDISNSTLSGNYVGGTSAHSQYFDTLVRSGVVGMLFEILIFIYAIKRSIDLKEISSMPYFFGAHASALIGILFFGIFHETIRWQMFGFYFWFYAGLIAYGGRFKKKIPAYNKIA